MPQTSDDRDRRLIGRTFGHIRIDEKLGEGGMGAVYAGFDEKLHREVALKTISTDDANEAARARFLREARILSQFEHPNICSIYGFVESEHGDFLVLERVAGIGLKEAMRSDADIDLLEVCRQLAAALAAAHARGVVHRDLKPDNVMLTPEGRVKVLDFGLAQMRAGDDLGWSDDVRAVVAASPSSEDSDSGSVSGSATSDSVTRAGSIVGTAKYMSPEQARGEIAVAASDIYSLGLIMQRLWTGRSPYRKGLRSASLLLAVANGDTVPVEGVDRDLAELIQQMKSPAIEDRPGAAQVVERLHRIADRPRRRRRRIAVALMVLLGVAAGFKYTWDVRRERNVALTALAEAEASRKQAEQSRLEARQVADFLVGLFEISEPGQARGETITARELLDKGAEELEDSLAGQPLVQARMRETIGTVYNLLGLYEPANELLEAALETRREELPPGDVGLASSLLALGSCYKIQGRFDEAEPLLVEALELYEQGLGPDHERTLESLNNLALLYWRQGRFAEAEAGHRRVLEVRTARYGEDHESVATSCNNLGEVIREQGRLDEAEPFLRRAWEIKRRTLGEDHPESASTLNNLGQLYYQLGRYEDAVEHFEGALRINEKVLGRDHLQIATNLNNLASAYDSLGRTEEAEALFLEALEIIENAVGGAHPRLAVALNNLGDLYLNWGRLDEAKPYFERSLELFGRSLGADHPYNAFPICGLASIAEAEGDVDHALELMREALTLRELSLDPQHPVIAETREAITRLEAEIAAR